MNHRYSTIALLAMLSLLLVGITVAAIENQYMWLRDTSLNRVYLNLTNNTICIGDTCNDAYQLTITHNASINGSPICTSDNGNCAGTDTNETTRVDNMVATNCTGQVVAGFYTNGTGYCEADDNDGGGGSTGVLIQLLNHSGTTGIFVEEYID